jgi:FtsZ-interacting cell division protein ZipA
MTLTVALAIVAGLVLLAVVVHGAWTARREQPRLPQAPAGAEATGRQEPTLGGAPHHDADMGDPCPRWRRAARPESMPSSMPSPASRWTRP